MRPAFGMRWLGVGGVLAALVLSATAPAAGSEFASATLRGQAGCPAGTFLDIGRGDCWSCPASYNRTIFAVDSAQACERPGSTVHKHATRHGAGTGLLRTDCPRGQFWDPNGYCYSCPSAYNRTLAPVTGAQACSRAMGPTHARATRSKAFGCPAGSFLDIGRGDCWSCPPQWHRTTAPVTSRQACARDLANVLTVDTAAICTQIIGALREGSQGVTRLTSDLGKVIDPAMKPIHDGMNAVTERIKTPAALDRMIDDLARSLRPHRWVIDEVQRLSNQMTSTGPQLQSLLLNPKVMCEGNLAQIDRQLTAIGLRPNLTPRASRWLDPLLVPPAQAAGRGGFAAYSVAVSVVPPLPKVGPSFSLTLSTNFGGGGGLLFSPGLAGGTAPRTTISVSAYIFPHPDTGDLKEFGELSSEINVGGTLMKKLFEKAGLPQAFMADNLIVSSEPPWAAKATPTPGWGVSKDVKTFARRDTAKTPAPSGTAPVAAAPRPDHAVDVGVSLDFGFKLIGW